MTATNKPMTGAQLDELMAVAMRMQSDSEKMGERPVSMFAYAVQVAVLEIRETRCKCEELQSQNADMSVHLANAESKCRELAAENAGLKAAKEIIRHLNVNREEANFCGIDDCHIDDAVEAMVTPATDAFLAEVRAQGVEALVLRRKTAARIARERDDLRAADALEGEAYRAQMFADEIRQGGAA